MYIVVMLRLRKHVPRHEVFLALLRNFVDILALGHVTHVLHSHVLQTLYKQ